MNKIPIIIETEYLQRARKKSFIILTLLMPFIIAALIFVPIWLGTINSNDQKDIAVIDSTYQYAQALKDNEQYHFITVPAILPEMKTDSSNFEAVVQIRGDLVKGTGNVAIYSRKEVPQDLSNYVDDKINEKVYHARLAATGIPQIAEVVKNAEKEVTLKTYKWAEDGKEGSSDSVAAMVIGGVTMMLIYMFVMMYGAMVMNSVTQEKTNRIVEVMVSSVKPFQLMMGKIIAIFLVGLTQMVIWGVLLTVILGIAGAVFGITSNPDMLAQQSAMAQQGMTAVGGIDPDTLSTIHSFMNLPYTEIIICFILFFLGGYLLFASFFAAAGASVNNADDAGQFVMPVTMIMVFGIYAASASINNPDGPLAFWTSLIPLTSPIVMMVRLPFGVPLWQIALSIALLFASAIGMVWISGKIYRTGILMYGKKTSLKEMIRWARK
ncbi:MAG: ABC transporter permease [Prevotella sp.]|nr:ABC transporter permease [Prevotella sp.]